jgi:hypothetical protein
MSTETTVPVDVDATSALVQRFEAATVCLEEFHHRQHLLTAAWLVSSVPFDEALDRMRRGLRGLLTRHGKTEGYHETVTVFWVRALAFRLAAYPADWPLERRLTEAVRWAETSRPLHQHYSAERLADPVGKMTFLDPDLVPVPWR